MMTIGIAIPAYKDARRLERCLHSIRRVDPEWLANVTVVDDSGDGRVANELRNNFDEVKWIVHDVNSGFAAAANDAVSNSESDWVILLNDDTELVEDPRPHLRHVLEKPNVFAVSMQAVNEDGSVREGAKRLVWRFGIAKILHNTRDQAELVNGVSVTAYAVGGHAVFLRKAFISLGGFDKVFHPFYWEDVDLSARARAEGYDVLYSDGARVLHHTAGAIRSSNNEDEIRRATWRNRLLFSSRHARGVHRMLFAAGLCWQSLIARLRGDISLQNAIADYKELSRIRES